MELSPEEVRVLGALIEKQLTTPQYYPLTLNALVAACNQSSNRWPVVDYDDGTAGAALALLRERGLIRVVHSPSNRATKYRHVLDEILGLDLPEVAVLDVLLLRGPQTVGELRGRTERMYAFADLAEVEEVLDRLAGRDEPLAVRLARQPGQKDARYVHLLGGQPDASDLAGGAEATGHAEGPASPAWSGGAAPGPSERPGAGRRDEEAGEARQALERRVASLEGELAQLRADLDELRALLQ